MTTPSTPGTDDVPLHEPLLFDMDGVFLVGPHTPTVVYADAADAALAELDPAVEPADDQRTILRNYGYTDSLEEACETLGIDPRAFWRRKEAHACRISHERIERGERELYDDVDAVAPLIADATSALVSNNRQATVEFVADHLGFGFDARRGREPTPEGYHRRKPRPDFLEATMGTLGVERGIYVGDSESDVVAASRAGLEPAFLRRPHNEGVPLPEGTTYELESLAALADRLDDAR